MTDESAAQDGGYAGAYLRAGVGVRALGLGGAFVAIANDVTAGYWNPAGLGQISGPQLAGMYSLLNLDRKYNYAALAWPFGAVGTFSASWINYRVGNIEARDQSEAVTGEFSDDETALLFSYGVLLTQDFALGGTVKLLRHALGGQSASGIGYDLGMLLNPSGFLTFGASYQDLQTEMRWNTPAKTREIFPKTARLGVNLKPISFINLGAEYEIFERGEGKWHAGGEIVLGKVLGLRAGNNNGTLTLGASLIAPSASNTIEIDYGFINDSIDRSAAHRVALLLKFNGERPLLEAKEQKFDHEFDEVIEQKKFVLLKVKVIEIRKQHLIVKHGALESLDLGMILKIYKSVPGKDTGKYYGAAEVIEVRNRYAILKMANATFEAGLSVGEVLVLKLSQQAAKN